MITTLGSVGATYGGLTGKVGADFGHGVGRFVTFTEVMSSPRLLGTSLARVDVRKGEKQNEVRRGDVLFNGSSETPEEVALAAVVDFDPSDGVYLNSFCFGYRLTRPGVIDPAYLSLFFRSAPGREIVYGLAQGATRYNIAKTKLLQMPLHLPRFEEQQQIAATIADCDDLIASLELLVTKKQKMKHGLMQELLTGRTRLSGFAGTWVTRTLGEVARIKTGSRNNQDKVAGGRYPFFVRSATVERIDSYSYNCEAILVPGEGGVGSIFHYVDGKFEVHQRVYKISDFVAGVSGKFIFQYMRQFFGSHALGNTVKATVDSLRLPTFTGFELTVPATREEQDAIARVLSDADAEIEALERRLESARAIRQGMMQELLTGRTRPVTEAAA